MAISELVTFDGGLSTKKSQHLIGRNEGIICQNVNLEKGTLYPLSALQFVKTVNGRHVYSKDGEIVSNQALLDDRFYAEFGGRLYWTNDGYANGLMRQDSSLPNPDVGVIAEPPLPLSDVEVSQITMAYDSSVNGNLTESGIYTYAFTIVDNQGVESEPKILSPNVDLVNKDNASIKMTISLANFTAWQTAHPTMDSINIYRTGGDNPTFNLIAESMSPTNPMVTTDSTNAYWHDVIADIDVSRIELTAFNNTPPPDNLDMLVELKGTMWATFGKRVYFSRTGSPEFWSPLDFITLNKECTGLGKIGDSIVAFTKTSAYLINGYNRDNVSVTRLPFNQGCISKHSVANMDAYLVWASMNGICIFDGASIQVITKNILSWDEFGRLGNATYDSFSDSDKWSSGSGFDLVYGTSYESKYYGVYNNGMMILDLSNGIKVSTMLIENIVAVSYNYEDNFLYAVVDNFDGTFDVYSQMNGETPATATWKTGRISEGSTNIRKHYRRIEMDGTPEKVIVFVDGEKVYEITNQGKFFLPSSVTGRDIQFEIETSSEIRGLKYEYTPLKG